MDVIPRPINMAQLSFRDGILILKSPLTTAVNTTVLSVMTQVQQLLNTEHLSEIVFILKSSPNVRVKLSEKEIRWIEKTEYENRDYRFSLETQSLLYNDTPADHSFLAGFAQKMDQLRAGIDTDGIQILGKKL